MIIRKFGITLMIWLLAWSAHAQQLKVMTFNIWCGGRGTGEMEGPRRVVDIIQQSGADIVAIQETYGSGKRIAAELGYYLYLRGANLSVMSRYPIIDALEAPEPFNSATVTIDVDGRYVVVSNNWLNYPVDYWDMLERGQPIDSAEWWRQQDEKNTGTLRGILKTLDTAIENTHDIPVIVCGDFNTGSHLDWVPATRHLNGGYVMPFPSTLLMEAHGFKDAFRQIYPNPLTHRGITWTPINPDAHPDRIDYVFYQGSGIRAVAAEVIDTHFEIYPSDHAAVLVTFQLN